MSVLINGMEMPDCGYVCLKVFANGEVLMTKVHRGALVITGIKDKVGTAVPVPPHGRLIDAGKLREMYEEWENDKEAGIDIDKCHVPIPVIRQNIDDAPTIILAEEGEHG